MNIKLISVASHPEHAGALIASAEKQGWDLTVIKAEWRGFGTKIIETYNWLKEHPEVTQFVFCDAFDVVVLGTPEEFEEKLKKWFFVDNEDYKGGTYMVFSAEKGCWPIPQLKPFFHLYEHGFSFLNSGVYWSKSDFFIQVVEKFKPEYDSDDQLWASALYLQNHNCYDDIVIDTNQIVFNSHSFIAEGEYGYENNRIQILGNEPIFIHCNGKTVDPVFNERIKI